MRKFTISVLGTKGGASKTTTAHLICHGLSKFMIRSILLTTDYAAGRKCLSDEKRLYKTKSGQTEESLKNAFIRFENVDVSKYAAGLVVDGGGNRQAVDDVLARYSDIILLPFKDSEEDIRVVIEDMKRLQTAYAIPSVWPTNIFATASAKRAIERLENEFPDRILKPVPVCRATQQLLREDFSGVDSNVASLAKNLVFDVLSKIDINPFKI